MNKEEKEKYSYQPWRRFNTLSALIEGELRYFREEKLDYEEVADVAFQCLNALSGLRIYLKKKQKEKKNE